MQIAEINIIEVHFDPIEVWVRGLYNSWWFCVHKLSMFIYLSVEFSDYHQNLPFFTEKPSPCYMKLVCHCLPSIASMALITSVFATIDLASRGLSSCRVPKLLPKITPGFYFTLCAIVQEGAQQFSTKYLELTPI